MPFTKEQYVAIQHEKGPMLVIAGPGSGKTAVLTHRLARLVSTGCAKPEEILVITFTRAAAREMRERYLQLVSDGAEPVIRTFHAAFYEILRHEQKEKLALLESGQATEILASWFRMEKKASPEEAVWKTDFVLAEYSRFRNTGVWDKPAILKIMGMPDGQKELAQAIQYYEEYKRLHQQIDFDDMMDRLIVLFEERENVLLQLQKRYSYILVDEFQDINRKQYILIKEIAALHRNLFIVGDDDQSIYGFRGSSPSFMLRFPEDFPETEFVNLTVNFRCGQKIVKQSASLIEKNQERYMKKLTASPENGRGEVIFEKHRSQETQASWICREIMKEKNKKICILCRTRKEFAPIQKALANHRLLCVCEEGDALQDTLTKIFEACFRWVEEKESVDERATVFQVCSVGLDPELKTSRNPDAVIGQEEMAWARRKLSRMQPSLAMSFLWHHLGVKKYMQGFQEKEQMRWQDVESTYWMIKKEAEAFDTFSAWFARIQDPGRLDLHLITMHGAKGLEFDTVFLPNLNEGNVPIEKAVGKEAMEEERRVLYVAMTRAREKLYLSYVKESASKRKPSRFFDDLSL